MKNFLTIVAMASLLSIARIPNAVAEPIVAIVNKANEVTTMTKSDLNRIYRGKLKIWPSGEKIKVVNLTVDDAARITFYEKVLNESANKAFYVSGSPKPFRTSIRKSAKSVLRFVSRFKGAMGYIPESEVDDSVKIVYTVN